MLGVLAGSEKSKREEMAWERRSERAFRYKDWKWVQTNSHGEELFDLSSDLGEAHDLSKQKPEVLKMMRERFAAWRKEMDDSEPRGPFRDW
jgi:arylsulfatase A-like enzyme